MSNKKKDMTLSIETKVGSKWREVYTARGEWYRHFRVCRVFGLDPMKPIGATVDAQYRG